MSNQTAAPAPELDPKAIVKAVYAIEEGLCNRMDVSAGDYTATVYRCGSVIRIDVKGVRFSDAE